MKEALAAIGILALAVSLWFVKGYSDERIINSKNETIESLKITTQSKEDTLSKSNTLLDSKDATIKLLQDSLQAKGDLLNKNKALIDSENATIKSLQEALQSNEAILSKDNDLISSYQQQISQPQPAPKEDVGNEDTSEKIYPKDNGFEAQNLGSGFFAYQVFGPIKNPHHVQFPDKIPNRTPWKFGGGNSGIAANGSGLYLTGATNFDSDGASSENGQAGFLEFAGSSISQSVELPAGTYSVTFDYEGRRNYAPANQISVSVDGKELFKGSPTDCDHFVQVTTRTFTVTQSGKHELMFRGLGAAGDVLGFHTTFIDNIAFNVVKPQIPSSDDSLEQVYVPPKNNNDEKIYPQDNGFDTQDLKSGFSSYQYFGETIKNPNDNQMPKRIPNMTPWTFHGNAGIAANGSGFYVTGATNLDSDGMTSTNGQAAFLEYADSSISQKIQLPAGTFTVSFDYEGRRNYLPANEVAVSIDGSILFKGAPTNTDHFRRITTDPITITTAGKHELMFRALGGLDHSTYPCTFIDNVCIDVVKLQTPPPPTPSYPDIGIIEDDWGPHPQVPPTHL